MTVPMGDTVTVAFVCIHDLQKFVVVSTHGATPAARTATCRQKTMLHIMNEHRGSQVDMVEEFMYRTKEAELKALERHLHLHRYYHRACNTVIQNLEEVKVHKCP